MRSLRLFFTAISTAGLMVVFIAFSLPVSAQQDSLPQAFYPENILHLDISSLLSSARVDNSAGPVSLATGISVAPSLGLHYSHFFKNNTGYSVALEFGQQSFRYEYELLSATHSIDYDLHHAETGRLFFIGFPVRLLARKPVSKRNEWQFNAGINLKKQYMDSSSYLVGYVNKSHQTVIVSTIETEFISQFLPMPSAGATFIHTFKSGFHMGLALQYTYSLYPLMSGHYSILENTPDHSTGKIGSRFSVFSLSLRLGSVTNRKAYRQLN